MLAELLDFVESILPSVDTDTKDKAKNAILQFKNNGTDIEYLSSNILPELSQGDIISEIKFTYFDEEGKQKAFKAKGMVISTSCHIDNRDTVNIVPVMDINKLSGDISGLKSNVIYNYMYIPESPLCDYFIDFSNINTYNKNFIINSIKKGKIKRIASLSQVGYYLFIIKLTVYLMRKEDDSTMSMRGNTA